MAAGLKGLKERPGIAHVLRAGKRFIGRLGNEFGAAITYFSVLAIVPIIMFAFAVTGLVLVELRPDLLDDVDRWIKGAIGGGPGGTGEKIIGVIDNALHNWAAIGIVGILSAAYAGAGWVKHLKSAVRAQWRSDFDMTESKKNIIVETLINLAILVGLLIMIVITFSLSSVATSLTGAIIGLLHLDAVPGIAFLLRFVPIIASVIAGWLLFMYLYWALPETKAKGKALRRGALMGAIGLGILQYLTSFLFGIFSANKAAALVGPVISLMLFLNLFARLILFIAAWIATTDQPALSTSEADDEVADQGAGWRDGARTAGANAAKPTTPKGRAAVPAWTTSNQHDHPVPQEVAATSVRIGIGAGYVTGAATGVGLGAMAALVMSKIKGRRSRDR